MGRLVRSEEHTSELQSRSDLVCRLLLEKKKFKNSSMNGDDTKTKALQVLEQKFDGVSNVVDSDIGLTVYAKNGSYMVPELVTAFDVAHLRLSTIGVSSPTLDDVFLKHTGKRIRVEEVSSANARGMFGRRRR